MNIKRIFCISLWIFFIAVALDVCEAYWVWTPQTKRWVNPKYSVKDTPRLQFEWAMDFYNKGEAPEAQYYVGICYEKMENSYQAFVEFQKVVDIYPNSTRFNEIIEHQYSIGERLYSDEKRKLGGVALFSQIDRAVEVFKKIVENAPYSEYGDKAQYKLGLSYYKMGETEQARQALQKLIEDYPTSGLADDAKLQLAFISSKASNKAHYEQEGTETAIKEYEDFLKEYPESVERKEAEAAVQELLEKKAQNVYLSAQFYERIKKPKSALICYEDIVKNYPDTTWTEKARLRIEVLKAWRE